MHARHGVTDFHGKRNKCVTDRPRLIHTPVIDHDDLDRGRPHANRAPDRCLESLGSVIGRNNY